MINYKIGDKVIHRFTDDILEIKRVGKVVATCILPESKWKHFATSIIIKNVVCLLSSLKPHDTQPNLSPH